MLVLWWYYSPIDGRVYYVEILDIGDSGDDKHLWAEMRDLATGKTLNEIVNFDAVTGQRCDVVFGPGRILYITPDPKDQPLGFIIKFIFSNCISPTVVCTHHGRRPREVSLRHIYAFRLPKESSYIIFFIRRSRVLTKKSFGSNIRLGSSRSTT